MIEGNYSTKGIYTLNNGVTKKNYILNLAFQFKILMHICGYIDRTKQNILTN